MRRLFPAIALIIAIASPATAQSSRDPSLDRSAPAKPNVSATGKTMPPSGSKESVGLKPSTEAEMIKAQKAAESRNKAWDAKMRRTMGTICTGC